MIWALDHIDDIFSIVAGVIAVASAIAALTPTPKDDSVIKWVRSMIDGLALNVGHAKKK